MGRKKRPFYRLVAIDSRKHRDGREVEKLGWFNPSSVDKTFKMNEDRVVYWLDKGAIPSMTVKNLLGKEGFNHKYHLIRMGKSDEVIEEETNEFIERQKERDERKSEKRKLKKEEEKKAEKASEEAPAKEAAVEEAPAEEAAVEEAPAEEAAAEEAPAEEAAAKKEENK
tara:strand:+ start:269 stop:775 length:507 start_codon:yes stop_codon:yes gene_type:complete